MVEEVIPNLEIVRPITSDQPLSECWCDGKGATGISVTQQGQKVFDHFCVCDLGTQMKKSQDDANAVRRLVGRGNVVDRLWERASVPRRFVDMRLENSPNTEYALRMVYSTGEPYQEAQEPESWFIHGAVGVGKTCLAVGYAYEMVQAHLTPPGSSPCQR